MIDQDLSGRWSEETGRSVVAAWHTSGLSQIKWCKQAGIANHRLSYWKQRVAGLRADDNGESILGFVELVPHKPATVRVDVSNGCASVTVGAGFDATLLRSVVGALL